MDEPTRGRGIGTRHGYLREATCHEVVGDPFGADTAFSVGGTKQF